MSAGQSEKIDCAKDGVRRLLKGLLPCQTERARQLRLPHPRSTRSAWRCFPHSRARPASSHSTDTNVEPHRSRARPERERHTVRGQPDRQAGLVHAERRRFPGWFFNGERARLSVGRDPDGHGLPRNGWNVHALVRGTDHQSGDRVQRHGVRPFRPHSTPHDDQLREGERPRHRRCRWALHRDLHRRTVRPTSSR